MSAAEIIEQLKTLPASERAQVARFIMGESDDSWSPAAFQEGTAEAGCLVDLDTARQSWLEELRRLREGNATNQPGAPLQQVMDDLRVDRA